MKRTIVNDDEEEFSFAYLKQKLNNTVLPSRTWGYATGIKSFCPLQKLEDDLRIRKRIAVLPDLHVKIYIDDKIMPLTEFIVITSMEQFAALLKKFDEIPLCSD